MKKKHFLLFIFCLFNTLVFSQAGNAVYGKQLASLIVKNSNTSNIEDPYTKKVLENLKNLEYQLTFKNNKAIYNKINSLDSNINPIVKAMTEGLANYRGITYFNNLTKSIIHEKKFAGNTYLINKKEINWVLTKDTLEIDNYTCYKATTIRTIVNSEGTHTIDVVAWYAPSISLSFGPDGYGGLPGLILQLENNGIITTLKKISFLKDNSIAILKPTKGMKITEREFDDITAKAYNNIKE